ncbi:hypothetical protein ACTJKH_17485 [Microbacterium sp. 22215]|uniref:hypothetical protein n=1 Tax=Microbacterium sp. 22215 TaxID=3453893 RepID=UPI003F8644F5
MFPEIILGPIAILLGVGVITGRRVFPGVMRAGLTRFYGEAVAEHLIVPRASLHLLIVGSAIVVMGCWTTVSGIFGW